MEVELFQDLVGRIGPFAVLVDAIEGVTCSLHRQRRDVEGLAVGRDGGDAGCYAKANVIELTQLLHHRIYLLSVRSLRVENGFRVIEDNEHLFRG